MAALRENNFKKERLESLFRQLKTYNGNRNKLLEQVAEYGGIKYSPLELQNKIEEIEHKISEIEKEIAELQEIPEPEVVVRLSSTPGEGQDFQKVSKDDFEPPPV